jgi:hypothetical protein
MAWVFLSHASADHALAARVRAWLVADGHEVFLDTDRRDGIPAGTAWKEHLYEQLRRASALVCVVTDAYIASQWCFAEVVAARVVGCPVVPLSGAAGVTHPQLTEIQHAAVHGTERTAGRARLLATVREYDLPGAGAWPAGRNPFPGLRPFEPDMYEAFRGRSAERDALVRMLRAADERDDRDVLAVLGPSGCGKSSLVRAGIIPLMRREPGWAVLPPTRPGPRPLTGLARAFERAMRPAGAWTVGRVRERLAAGGLTAMAEDYLTVRSGPPARRILLVMDQFEELLTQAAPADRRELAEVLRPAVADGLVRLVVTVRSEFLDLLLSAPEFVDLPVRGVPLRPLDAAMLRTVVAEPMRLAGVRVEPELVDRIVADTGGGDGLPLLAYTLRTVTEGLERGGELTAQAYEASGGVRGTLVREADAALREAARAGGRAPDDVLATLLRLVRVDTAGRASRIELDRRLLDEAGRHDVAVFVRRRLLSTDAAPSADTCAEAEPDGGDRVSVSMAHEAFLREWPPLASAIEDHRSGLRMRTKLEDAAGDWVDSGRRSSYLWDRFLVKDALEALGLTGSGSPAPYRPDLDAQAVEFLVASIRRNRRRARRLWTVAAGAVAILLTLTTAAVVQWRTAVGHQRLATAQALVARAEQRRDQDIREALRLNLAAERIASTLESRQSLASTLAGTPLAATIRDGRAREVAFSPDKRIMATIRWASASGALQLWDVSDPRYPARLAFATGARDLTGGGVQPRRPHPGHVDRGRRRRRPPVECCRSPRP